MIHAEVLNARCKAFTRERLLRFLRGDGGGDSWPAVDGDEVGLQGEEREGPGEDLRLAMSGKKVSGTFCAKHPEGECLAKGTGH